MNYQINPGQFHANSPHPHGSKKSYLLGFILSVVLTAGAFWLAMSGGLGSKQATSLAIVALGAAQMIVHMIYFLHMSPHAEGGWTMMALIFTVILVVIALTGSVWVMYHLTTNMMPVMQDMRQVP